MSDQISAAARSVLHCVFSRLELVGWVLQVIKLNSWQYTYRCVVVMSRGYSACSRLSAWQAHAFGHFWRMSRAHFPSRISPIALYAMCSAQPAMLLPDDCLNTHRVWACKQNLATLRRTPWVWCSFKFKQRLMGKCIAGPFAVLGLKGSAIQALVQLVCLCVPLHQVPLHVSEHHDVILEPWQQACQWGVLRPPTRSPLVACRPWNSSTNSAAHFFCTLKYDSRQPLTRGP